jgi:hypothetical protein
MEGIPIPKTLTIYTLVRQVGMCFSYTGYSSNNNLGVGFFLNEKDAEYQRTVEILKGEGSQFHIFPLTVPNPAYKE